MDIHHLDLNGERLCVREAGRRGRPAVFYFHSLGLSSAMWAAQFEALHDDRHLIAMDCRGHGESSNHGGFSIGHCVDDAQVVLKTLDVPRAHLVGLSMGGLMVAELAARWMRDGSARCLSMVLACSYCAMGGPAALARIDATRKLLADKGMAAFGSMYMDGTACASMDPVLKARMASLIAGMAPDDYLQTLQGILNHDARPALAQLGQVPALVLSGRLDQRVTPEALQELKDAVPHAQVLELHEAGHLANLEEPARFSRVLDDFWRSVP